MSLRWSSVIILIFTIIYSCNQPERVFTEELENEKTDRFQGLRKSLKNKPADFIKRIPQLASRYDHGGFVFYYSGYDCGTCVSKGLKSVKWLKSLGYEVEVVSFQTSLSQDQGYFNFKDKIWVDQEDYLHESFDFIPTPFFLLIDQKFSIKDLHFPLSGDDPDSTRFFMQFEKNELKLVPEVPY